jgi:hypothetical protein
MNALKSTAVYFSVIVLVGACSRTPDDADSLAQAEPASESELAQTWEPVQKTSQPGLPGQAAYGVGRSSAPGSGGPGGNQPAPTGFPEGSMPARQPPVPDHILAAEMAKADAAAAAQFTQAGPALPGRTAPSVSRGASQDSKPDPNVRVGR